MVDIILAFFAVLGIGLLGSMILDVLYYKKHMYGFPLIVDLRTSDMEEAWNKLGAVSLARKNPGGRAVLSDLIVLVSTTNHAVTEGLAVHYLHVFDLPGAVFTEEDAWYSPYQNTPSKDGTNPS